MKLTGLGLVGFSLAAVVGWLVRALDAFGVELASPMNAGGDFGFIGRVLHALRTWVAAGLRPDELLYWAPWLAAPAVMILLGAALIAGRPKILRRRLVASFVRAA